MKSWKEYQKLRMKKYRDVWRLFTVEGVRLCQEALTAGWPVEAAFCSESFRNSESYDKFERELKNKGTSLTILKENSFKQLSDTEQPQGILLIVSIPEVNNEQTLSFAGSNLILVLDGIRDPGNMGTLIRSADWFGVELIISSSDAVDYYNPKVVRASMGSIFHIKLLTAENISDTILNLKKQKFQVISTSPSSTKSIADIQVRSPVALILGGEAEGVAQDLQKIADENIAVKKYGKAESLNVSVAGGILLQTLADKIFSSS
jgi:TrmH family RNA methyltransferase